MKDIWIISLLIVVLSSSLKAQSNGIPAFNALLRDLDLNADTQNGYAITEAEYGQLLMAWKSLPLTDRQQLLYGPVGKVWEGTFARILLLDFVIDMSWEQHVEKMINQGAKGLSLTISRYKSRISVKTARKTVLDLLYKGPSMFTDGRLAITAEIKNEVLKRAGKKALKRLERWEELINGHEKHSDWAKLTAVNDFFNQQITVALDRRSTKGYDYWQSPIETLVRGKGDCDDFAVAKYVSLRLLGISAEQLRVGLVMHPSLGGHAVVFFYPVNENDPWVLDDMFSERLGPNFGRILRLSARINFDGFQPLWGLNENRLTEFSKGLNENPLPFDPRDKFPAFDIALYNSHRLLPQNKAMNLALAGAIR